MFFQVRTDFDRLEETKFMITINSAESVNYICVFLTGLIPFPEGTAGFGKCDIMIINLLLYVYINGILLDNVRINN